MFTLDIVRKKTSKNALIFVYLKFLPIAIIFRPVVKKVCADIFLQDEDPIDHLFFKKFLSILTQFLGSKIQCTRIKGLNV